MGRSSIKSLKTPRGTRKAIRKGKRRKKKARLVNKRYMFGNEASLPPGLRINFSSSSDEGKSDDRKDGIKERGIEFDKEDTVKVCFCGHYNIAHLPNKCTGFECQCKDFNSSDKLKFIEEDRGKIYGDPFLSHQAIGLAWEGVFRNRYHEYSSIDTQTWLTASPGQLFPADLVAEMFAAFKIVRLARPIFKQDSADDAKVYISFSERFRKK